MMPLADGSVSQELSSRFRRTLGSNRPERSAVFAEDTVTLRRTAATAGCAEGEHRVALVASRGGAIGMRTQADQPPLCPIELAMMKWHHNPPRHHGLSCE